MSLAVCTAGLCGNEMTRGAFVHALYSFSLLGTGRLYFVLQGAMGSYWVLHALNMLSSKTDNQCKQQQKIVRDNVALFVQCANNIGIVAEQT
eukprot:13147969-Ditylum_brightwellii.AAC.1